MSTMTFGRVGLTTVYTYYEIVLPRLLPLLHPPRPRQRTHRLHPPPRQL